MTPLKVILLVEDNKQDELLTLRALGRHGVRQHVVVCRDGAEAIDWVHARGRFAERDESLSPAVVLLDLKMPKADGIEVLHEIRATPSTRRLPVVILTTSREERDIQRSYDGGANSFVQKPIDFDAFSDAIRDLGAYWLKVNEPPRVPPSEAAPIR